MQAKDINHTICEGDYIIDPMDREVRQVAYFVIHDPAAVSVFMVDGGVVGLDEIPVANVRLASEVEG